MVSLWQRIFNVFVIILILYLFWFTSDMRSALKVQLDINRDFLSLMGEQGQAAPPAGFIIDDPYGVINTWSCAEP